MSTLTIKVEGLRNQKGQLCVSLFGDSHGFPTKSHLAIETKSVEITGIPSQVIFDNLEPGNYAVAILHDENGDGQLNCNFLGIPTEGFGFSQNPTIRVGAPKFAESTFIVASPKTNIQVKLNYLLGK
jgi:uncharacterized protein (DUF2141 family)